MDREAAGLIVVPGDWNSELPRLFHLPASRSVASRHDVQNDQNPMRCAMRRVAGSLSLILMAVALVAAPVAAQDSVAGKWVFNMASPQGQMDVEFTFAQSGAEVTGTVELPAMPEIEGTEVSDGLYEDGILSFLLHVSMQGQWFTVEVEAEVDGDEMVGEAYMAEMGESTPFTAKRAEG